MSIEAVTWALRVPVGGNAKVVLLGLANHAHPDGTETYPALDTLAEYAHCDRSTARRNVRKLVADGWAIEDGVGPKGQAKYRLPLDRIQGGSKMPPSQNATGGTAASGGVAPMPPEPSIEPLPLSENRERVEPEQTSDVPLGEQLVAHESAREGNSAEIVDGEIVELAPPLRFNGKPVPPSLASDALAALAHYNEQTGQALRPTTASGKPSEGLSRILGAMIEHPEVRVVYRRMIEHTLLSRWWGHDEPHPGVIFGPRVVEQSIQRAHRRPVPGANMRLKPAGEALRALRLASEAG